MRSFNDYRENVSLFESMDSAVEFDMTDDTLMPKQIFAAMSINGSDYGFSLVQSTYDKVYVLELYRIVSVKKRTWAFKSTADIRPVLSSLLKFVESSYPFIKSKMDGIIIDIPGKSGSEKYEKLLTRILKKTYISTFRVVPVIKTTDKARNYIFLTRKAIQPGAIFKSAAFHKHFEFDAKDVPVEELFSSENVDKMTEPYRVMKPTVSLAPSKKYTFKKVELGDPIDDADVNLAVDIANKASKSKGVVGAVDLLAGVEVDEPDNIIAFEYNAGDAISDYNMPLAYIITRGMHYVLADVIKKFGPDFDFTNKLSLTRFKKSMKYTCKNFMSKSLVEELHRRGLITATNMPVINAKTRPIWKRVFKDTSLHFLSASNPDAAYNNDKGYQVLTTINYNQKQSSKTANPLKYAKTLELPFKMQAEPDSPFGRHNETTWSNKHGEKFGFVVEDEIGEKINADTPEKTYISAMPEVATFRANNVAALDDYSANSVNDISDYTRLFMAARHYTGSGHKAINSGLRNLHKVDNPDEYYMGTDTKRMLELFVKHAPRLDAGVWVYRNTNVPGQDKFKVGDDFVDPGFLSTSVKSKLSLGADDNPMRLKIFLPKGTKCMPVFGESGVKREDEIILAPYSNIKLTEVYMVENSYNKKMYPHVVGLYTGNGAESLFEAIQTDTIKSLFEATKDNSKKKPDTSDGKWSDPLASVAEMEKIAQLISKGKIKIKS